MSRFSLSKQRDDQYVISEEDATEQIVRILDYYDYDIDEIEDADERKKQERELMQLVKLVRRGRIEVVFEGERPHIRQHLHNGDSIDYAGRMAKAMTAMDGHSQNDRFKQMHAFMGSLSNLGAAGMQKLEDRDNAVMLQVAGFLSTMALSNG